MEAGQKIFIKTQNNKARYTGSKIIEATVTKVGRKYFWVDKLPRTKFSLENMNEVTDYCVDYIAYYSLVAIEEELEKTAIEEELRKAFSGYGKTKYTIEQLRKVNAVLCGG